MIELLLQHDALRLALALAATRCGDCLAQFDDLVGEQPGARIAHGRRDLLGLFRDLGLVPERLELPSDFARKVREPKQVRLHRLEFAQSLLFAAAMLENSGCLFNEPAAILRRRVQHGVELTLADDDVHLAAEPRVAQQFLHIE